MAPEAFKAKLARVEALRLLDDETALAAGLTKALSDRSNFVVAKAARIAGSRYALAVLPALLAAYDRLFIDAEESDPQTQGKEAIAQALKDLDHREAAPFVRGLKHVQLEPAWGGTEDRAGPLRATCAHALVACDIDRAELLRLLTDRLFDPDAVVRRDVVRAIAQSGGFESVLLLRLKALSGDVDAEVFGECFALLLDLEPRESVEFVARFLTAKNAEVVIEAAGALAGSRVADAFNVVRRLWAGPISSDLRRSIVFSCAASPLTEAAEFLLSIVAGERADLVEPALTALAASRLRHDFEDRARQAVAQRDDDRLGAMCARAFAVP
jgi:hypothetical protein